MFGAADIPSMAVYPADGNTRVRWDGASLRGLTDGDFTQMRNLAVKSIAAEAKGIKNTLKNAMANPIVYKLTVFGKIGKTPEGMVMKDKEGGSILLEDFPELEGTLASLEILPNAKLFENGIALCGYWYSAEKRRLCAQPLCIIPDGENNVIRLLY